MASSRIQIRGIATNSIETNSRDYIRSNHLCNVKTSFKNLQIMQTNTRTTKVIIVVIVCQ